MLRLFLIATALASGLYAADDAALSDGLLKAGVALANRGRAEQAEQMLWRALAYNERCTTAYVELARLTERGGDKDGAVALYRKALMLDPSPAERRDVETKIRILSPLFSKLDQALLEYAKSIAKIRDAHPMDGLVLGEIESRSRSLLIKDRVPKPPTIAPILVEKRDLTGKWMGSNPAWTRPSIVDLRSDGSFLMLDKHLVGTWRFTNDDLTLEWSGYPADTLARVDRDSYSVDISGGVFTLSRVKK